jgi:hypothetical protein
MAVSFVVAQLSSRIRIGFGPSPRFILAVAADVVVPLIQ